MPACKRCLMPDTVPGVDLDAAGVCAYCRAHDASDPTAAETDRKAFENDLEQTLASVRGDGKYDVLVNLSGGKDSCLLLHRLVTDYPHLRLLAFTTNINIPDIAWDNIRRTVDKLDVDHLVFTPPRQTYRKLFRYLLQNQEERGAVRTVCYVCAPMYEGYSLRVAVEKRIPLIVAGYAPGQPDPDRMRYEFSRRLLEQTDWTPPEVRESGLFTTDELALFWNPLRLPHGTRFPRYLAPFHAWPYHQEQVMKRVVELGLVSSSKHASPVHSNCPVNWLLMYSDLRHLGYNPYQPEFSSLVRTGKASRTYWRIMGPIVNWMIRHQVFLGRNVKKSLQWLGMSVDQLKVTRPAPPSSAASSAIFPGARPRGRAATDPIPDPPPADAPTPQRIEYGPTLRQALHVR